MLSIILLRVIMTTVNMYPGGLYYKTSLIRNLREMEIFRIELVSSVLGKHTSLNKKHLLTESVMYLR
jgi:hypothetical protein